MKILCWLGLHHVTTSRQAHISRVDSASFKLCWKKQQQLIFWSFLKKNSILPNCLFSSQPGSLSIELKTAIQNGHLCMEPSFYELLL